MIQVWYVEDEPQWGVILNDVLSPYDIEVTTHKNGEELINAVFADQDDECEAVLIDWILYESDGQIEQPLQGGDIYEELKRIKPYLPQYVVTHIDELDRITNRILARYRFRRYFAKKWVEENDDSKILDFANDIKAVVAKTKEVLSNLPNHQSWAKYREAYLSLRYSEAWPDTEKDIESEVERLSNAEFSRQSTLNRVLPNLRGGEIQIRNILLARRVILAELFRVHGRWHHVEEFLGYEQQDERYDNPYKIHDGAFRTYCNLLGFRPDELRSSGQGLLIEEKRWLEKFCKSNNLSYGFPVVQEK
jgi:hypothetical protein